MYQSQTGQLMLKPLPEEYRYEGRPLIEILFWEQWMKGEQEGLNEMYLQLYPVKIARKKILVELVRVFGSANFRGEHLDVLSKIFFQFGQMESVLLKIFAKGIVRPIASYHLRPRFVEAF